MSAPSSSRKPEADLAGTLLRILFAIAFATAGFLLGRELYDRTLSLHIASGRLQLALLIVSPVIGALAGVLLTPYAQVFFESALTATERSIERRAPSEIAGGVVGLIAGLIIAFLIKSILFDYIRFVGQAGVYVAAVLYLIISVFAAYLGARVGAKQRVALVESAGGQPPQVTAKIIDTSVIVDGRIAEIVESGFLDPPFVVPRFVLHEIQLIADSTDSIKRSRGRRALDVLSKLQEVVPIEISEIDYPDVVGVDAKLVRMAREIGGRLVTNDYNLNRVAQVEGVAVLNINELANAVKPIVLPGEEMHVAILREGKEAQQGVGYLDDGTMIVVENGRRLIGESTDVVVTSVLQTVAGRMIFAKAKR
ncbi:MAG: hypothetical protein JO349_02085 [Candidatus Eremiobacteraeota bacterium]|nr:hypothetical protein [Candidatus Eremiobacteraeota bacterium]